MSQVVSKQTKHGQRKDEQDQLSALWNRKSGLEKLTTLLISARERNSSFFVVLTDINDLSIINKNQGHEFGDRIIRSMAAYVRRELGLNDIAMRLTGDEFLIVFTNIEQAEIDRRMMRIKEQIKADYQLKGIEVSFCYGCLHVNSKEYQNVKQMIADVDNCMYRYKKRFHLMKSKMKSEVQTSEEARNFVYAEEYLLDALLKSTDDYIYVCNMQENPSTFRYSKAMIEEFGLAKEVIENAADVWGSHIHEADKKAFIESNRLIENGVTDYHNVEYRARNKDGKWVWLRCRGYVERNANGEAILFAGFITTLGRKNKVDHLTGLFNKFEFEDTIQQLCNRKDEAPFSIILLDLDDFSTINKLYNHKFGDEVLALTAQRLQSILPENAKIFRNEGDEFYIVLRDIFAKEEIKIFYDKLQYAMEQLREHNGKKFHCTLSVGCVRFPEDACDFSSLSKNVSYALEYSKRNGKKRMTFFDKDMLQDEIRELDMMEQLRYSVEHDFDGFHLHFQPQVEASSGNVIGTEALTRWNCDMYGNVPPLTFIPLLEKSGLIIPVGKWIFEQAVKQCKAWTLVRPTFGVSINLSYLQLDDSAFLQFMKDMLTKYEISPQNIVVEMTESYMMKSSDAVKENFLKIRELGIRIAMDDFGTGYSSLGVLKNTPADIVKIDKIFMKNILVDDFDTTFIKFIVRLCHDVGISVLLEGVETVEEYEKVKQLGLDFIQGYFFGKPMESDKVGKILN